MPRVAPFDRPATYDDLVPAPRTLEVLRLENGRWTIVATYGGDQVVRAEPFSEVEVQLSALWADI